MNYSPFDRGIFDISGPDLTVLREVSEGWYVEYKSQRIAVKALGKSLSAFANQYGGWLFIGVKEKDGVACDFPGIQNGETLRIEEDLRNASATCITPNVYYEHRIISGPVKPIDLPEGRSVVVVRIPPGAESPYVHNDGKIYRRVADSSNPKPETDRSALDSLWRRSRRAKDKVHHLTAVWPNISKAETDVRYLHTFISADPFEIAKKNYYMHFSRFEARMREDPISFDNCFSCNGGYIARQTKGNDPQYRVFTWEYQYRGHSRITLPLTSFPASRSEMLRGYRHADRFIQKCNMESIGPTNSYRVLDLNETLYAIMAIIRRYRVLLSDFGEHGPFYLKFKLENIWRCTPYYDTDAFIDFISRCGIPVAQDTDVLIPDGDELESFISLPRIDKESLQDNAVLVSDASRPLDAICSALGIPTEVTVKSASELLDPNMKEKIDNVKILRRHYQ